MSSGELSNNNIAKNDEVFADAADGPAEEDVECPEVYPRQRAADEREAQCGIGSWRPRCLRPFGNMWCFTAALCAMFVFNSSGFAYYVAVITQIERRFGLSSQTTGFIKNVDNIGFMLTVMAVSHLGRYGNKPRILGASCILSGAAIFIFAVPHFIYGGPGTNSFRATPTIWNASNSTVERRQAGSGHFEVCDGVDESLADPDGCESHSMLLDFNAGAMALFIISELLQGMANAPKPTMSLTYMDDNARERSPTFFGKYLTPALSLVSTIFKNQLTCVQWTVPIVINYYLKYTCL